MTDARSIPAPTSVARPGRLSRSADVQRVLRRGRSSAGDLLALHRFERPAGERATGHVAERAGEHAANFVGPRLTVVASKRVGNAVRRNRAKRLLREAARLRAWRDGLDVVLVARAPSADSDVHLVGDELDRLGARLDVFMAAP